MIEVHRIFSNIPLILPLNLRAQDLSQKLILEKNKKCYREKKCHGLGTQQESRPKNGLILDDFGLGSPVVQKTFQAKSATSMVARIKTFAIDKTCRIMTTLDEPGYILRDPTMGGLTFRAKRYRTFELFKVWKHRWV